MMRNCKRYLLVAVLFACATNTVLSLSATTSRETKPKSKSPILNTSSLIRILLLVSWQRPRSTLIVRGKWTISMNGMLLTTFFAGQSLDPWPERTWMIIAKVWVYWKHFLISRWKVSGSLLIQRTLIDASIFSDGERHTPKI